MRYVTLESFDVSPTERWRDQPPIIERPTTLSPSVSPLLLILPISVCASNAAAPKSFADNSRDSKSLNISIRSGDLPSMIGRS